MSSLFFQVANTATDEQLDLDEGEFQKLVRHRLVMEVSQGAARQKVVDVRELEQVLANCWEFVSTLPTGKAVVKKSPLA